MSVGRPRVIKRTHETARPEIVPEKQARPSIRDASMSFLDQLAQSTVCIMGHKWQGADSDFPNEPWLRSVRYFYPYAVGGPILADELSVASELPKLLRKQQNLRERGFRYFIYKRAMSLADAYLELDKCLGQLPSQN